MGNSPGSLARLLTKEVLIIATPNTRKRLVLIQFDQFSLDKFKRQNLVYLKGIVSLPTAMSFQDLFQRIGAKVGSTARAGVEQHFLQAL